MPFGLVLIRKTTEKGLTVVGRHVLRDFELNEKEMGEIFSKGFSGKKLLTSVGMKVNGTPVAVKFMQKKEKKKLIQLALVLLLDDKAGDKAEDFFKPMDDLEIHIWRNLDKQSLKMNLILQKAFKRILSETVERLDPKEIQQRVIKRAQDLLDEAKINKAQELLSYSKSKPDKMVNAARDGTRFRDEGKYEKSASAFELAAQIARLLCEDEL
ncbi:MAG: hypothetical protein ACTSXP_13400, partial [Promethearchaeota archaeon]